MAEEKKRRRRRKRKKNYNFDHLLTEEKNDLLSKYIKNYQRTPALNSLIKEIYDSYQEKTTINVEIEDFQDYIYSCLDCYIEYEELSFYFFLKRKIEEGYGLLDKRYYFDDEQEFAIRLYIQTTDQNRRDIIYNKFLKYPFEKLAEAQLNTTKLYSHFIGYESLLNRVISFVHEKLDRFDPNRGTKAYSYFGTTIKNKLKDIRRKEHKKMGLVLSYEDMFTVFEDDPKYSYKPTLYETNINLIVFDEIKPRIKDYYENNIGAFSDKEEKAIYAIIQILDDWNSFFETGSNKLKKKEIYSMINNLTNLETKEITAALRGIRKFYKEQKKEIIEKHYIKYD